ncbi:MAG TPA: hypothetical protein VFE38_16120 [Edaphobacter sp.]|nr:hypothetical protein [Edaphobacter sp.]
MDGRLKVATRWVVVLLTLSATSLILFIFLMGFMLWPDRSLVAAFTAIGIHPRATIEAAHRLDFFLAALFWVMPPAFAIGFAARQPQRRSLSLGLSISVLLFATVCFIWGRQDSSASMEWIALIAGTIVLSAVVFSFFQLKFYRSLTIVNFIAILLLFAPSIIALSRRTRTIPEPKELWSTTLQQEQWQSMNTGSEYAATRQVAFAGDRVIAVFDTGFGPSQPSKDKWPVSAYRLISLDLKTGTKLKEITIAGRWGSMPYIYPTQEGFIDVQSNPPRILNQDLVPVTDTSPTAPANRTTTQKRRECGSANCDPLTYFLGKNTVQLRQKHFQVVDSMGQVLSGGNLVERGAFAGASADGHRFAIQSSYTEGDPDFVVYEYFTIYDAANGNVLSAIHMKNLPARQSWSAFSSDGRYFVAGNPNKLTMYELP